KVSYDLFATILIQISNLRLILCPTASIKSVASDMAEDMMSFYTGNEPGQTPGLLPKPYYWWEGGALMGALIDYWYYTGDTRWNQVTQQGLLFQVGPDNDYMPPNQTMTEGNDDQGFWGMAVLSAAEYNFPNPPASGPQWLALAQNVFNSQAARWNTAQCGGGLRWQIFMWNNGYLYKNSISQACFFNMASRLALYTGNDTYAVWANRIWDWMVDVKFLHQDSYYIYDGAAVQTNCTEVVPYQWTYNAGAFLHGAAAMYNYTAGNDPVEGELWRSRVNGLLTGLKVFFIGHDYDIMAEVACEGVQLCDNDEQSFKAYLARWMAATTKWAPWTYSTIKPLLEASAAAAATQCTGGGNGRMCGLRWANNSGKWDGTTGVGQQMAAMEVVLGTMIQNMGAPVTNSSGGTSPGIAGLGQPGAGQMNGLSTLELIRPISKADGAGAYLLTVLVALSLLGAMAFMFRDEEEGRTVGERWRTLQADLKSGGSSSFRPAGEKGPTSDGQQNRDDGFENINLDGPSTPAPRSDGEKKASLVYSISFYGSEGMRPSMALSQRDDHPNEQPWRRAARPGDYAGAFDPSRGNGAGFGILEPPMEDEPLGPPANTNQSDAVGKINRWSDVNSGRTLTVKNLRL
ncbi:glycosylhydrolase family 76-1, partial [Diaporthe helianthi]